MTPPSREDSWPLSLLSRLHPQTEVYISVSLTLGARTERSVNVVFQIILEFLEMTFSG